MSKIKVGSKVIVTHKDTASIIWDADNMDRFVTTQDKSPIMIVIRIEGIHMLLIEKGGTGESWWFCASCIDKYEKPISYSDKFISKYLKTMYNDIKENIKIYEGNTNGNVNMEDCLRQKRRSKK